MTTETQARIELMDGPQTDFFESAAKHPALFAGRRSGKTVVGVVKAFNYVFEHPGAHGVITAPDMPQFRRTVWPVIQKFFGSVQGDVWEWYERWQEIKFLRPEMKGSVIYVRPAGSAEDAAGFRGMDVAFFYMDEIAVEHQHESFLLLKPALTQEGYPHQGWVTSTPDWRKPWIRKIWVENVHPQTGEPMRPEEYQIFRAYMENNWHLPGDIMADLQEAYGKTRWAEQELHGEFIIVEGAGFPMFDASIHVREPPHDIVWKEVGAAGLDFGTTSPTSMHEVCLDRSNRAWVTKEFYKRNADEYDWVKAARDWNLKDIRCDPSISEDTLKKLRNLYGVPLKRARFKEFDPRVQAIRRRLTVREDGRPGMYISPSCPNLIGEIQSAAFERPRGQEYETDRWMTGTQDHALDSTAYRLMEIDLPPPDFRYRPKVIRRGWDY